MPLLLFAALAVLGCRHDGRIDEPCLTADDCLAADAVCAAWLDDVDRCAATCTRDGHCGPGAHCVTDTGATGNGAADGACWRTCRTDEDCAGEGWACVSALDARSRRYCVLDS